MKNGTIGLEDGCGNRGMGIRYTGFHGIHLTD